MYVCMYVCMYVLLYVWHSIDGFTSLFVITPVFQIVSEIHSNITSNTDKIQGNHFHNHFPALSFATSVPFPWSFPVFLHIPFLNFAFCPNSVSEENWEHVGLSGPIIFLSTLASVQAWVKLTGLRGSLGGVVRSGASVSGPSGDQRVPTTTGTQTGLHKISAAPPMEHQHKNTKTPPPEQ